MLLTLDSLPPPEWGEPAALPKLPPGRVVVYALPHADAATLAGPARRVLAPNELARAGRYFQAADQQRFALMRAALRLLLGRYTGQAAAAVALGVAASHKPYLPGYPALHFSLTHTRRWGLIAVADQAVGIDAEDPAPGFDYELVLASSFQPAEQRRLAESPDSRLFFEAWTRKEAFVKATGRGIDDHFAALPALPGRYALPAQLAGTEHDWQVSSFEVAADCVAALAYPAPGNPARLRFVRLSEAWLGAALAAEPALGA